MKSEKTTGTRFIMKSENEETVFGTNQTICGVSTARPDMQSTNTPRCFKNLSFRTALFAVLLIQNSAILLILLLTLNGLLVSFDYEGIYSLFILIPGPLSSWCALLATWRILGMFPSITNGWVCIVLIPGIFNMLFGSIQTIILFFMVRRIVRWFQK